MWRGVATFKRTADVNGSLDPKAQVLRLNHYLGSWQSLSAPWQPPCREALLGPQSHVPPQTPGMACTSFLSFTSLLAVHFLLTKYLFIFHFSHADLVFLA